MDLYYIPPSCKGDFKMWRVSGTAYFFKQLGNGAIEISNGQGHDMIKDSYGAARLVCKSLKEAKQVVYNCVRLNVRKHQCQLERWDTDDDIIINAALDREKLTPAAPCNLRDEKEK